MFLLTTGVEVIFPACTVDGTAVSKTIHILYRNDEVVLDDIMLFRAFILVDSHKVSRRDARALEAAAVQQPSEPVVNQGVTLLPCV